MLGFPEAKFYKSHNSPYFGETIGRTTNRIKNAQLSNLNGKTYHLQANEPPNCLHGGIQGWGKQDFEGPLPTSRNGKEGVRFTYLSKDGDEGYPGTVKCTVWYATSEEKDIMVLDVEYQVEFVGDECAETVVGVTNHRYDLENVNLQPGRLKLIIFFLATSTSILPLLPSKVLPSPSPPISTW